MSRFPFFPSVLLFIATAATLLPVHGAQEPSLDDLRKSGVVGERYDGIAVVRDQDVESETRSFLESVNAKRREIYQARAKKQGAPVEEVGKVYALEIAEKAPAGTWFLGEDEKWVRKK